MNLLGTDHLNWRLPSASWPASHDACLDVPLPHSEASMRTVLIVDDEPSCSESLQLILLAQGYQVFVAGNGVDGLNSVETLAPELVILDFMMPLMNGAEVGRRLRGNLATRHIPIIISSGTSEDTVRQDFPGYDVFLRKPNNVDELLSAVRRLLESPPVHN